jgi:hypothetical protein
MRVIATKVGFFDYLRQVGEEFEVPDGTKGSWFKPVPADEPEAKPARGRKASSEPADDQA